MKKTWTIGLAGCGTVGGGVMQLLQENRLDIEGRCGADIFVKTIAVRDTHKVREEIPTGCTITEDVLSIANDPEIDVVMELMGGLEPAKTLIRTALANGKHVITANKALLAQAGGELFELAAEKNCLLMYEASVAGGVPIIHTLRESLAANRILSFEGILNGTGNYILSEMTSKGKDFASALADAQALGYAEADPTLDIDGHDTAHKLVLLIRLAWGMDYPYSLMPVRGIRHLDSMDIQFAKEFGFRIKLLGRAQMQDGKLDASVCPTLVNYTYLLARVGGAYNAVRLEGNAVGSLFLHGQGAGGLPTASAVVGDLLSVIRGTMPLNSGFTKHVLPTANMLPPEESESAYYMRFMVKDHPGVLRDLAGALAEYGVSIAQAIQKPECESGVPLVFMTHKATAKAITAAVNDLRKETYLCCTPVWFKIMQ